MFLCLLMFPCLTPAKEYSLKSPNGRLLVTVSVTDRISFSVSLSGSALVNSSPISMRLKNSIELGLNPVLTGIKNDSVDETIEAVVPVKNKTIRNNYNELLMSFQGNYSISFRAYDDGMAYRFITSFPGDEITVEWENARFNFAGNYRVFFPEEELWDFVSHYERSYKDTNLAAIKDTQFCSLPVLLSAGNKAKLLITEADLYDYPNMFLYGTDETAFRTAFPKVTLALQHVNDRDDDITKLADYIAVVKGKRNFPWRVILVAESDKDLLETDLVFKLSSPNVIKNTSWIKPGRVAWDWWNDRNIYNVGFPSGINTNTYKYYVDFASRFGLEYVILDEGWSLSSHDLLHTVPEMDLKELVQYANKKNVGLILWVLWNALDENMTVALNQFASWGIKGIKVDFMQRGDQYMVNFYERVASEAAKRNLAVDFHGAYKPSGLNRKYPNVLSQEGVKGLEHSKWSTDVTPKHDVTLPFTRMVAGPMDFTPGAMINANKEDFRAIFSEPMSQGTRCHQAAMYVVYTSPLQMFSDSPSNYLKDSVFTSFITRMPSTWDKTVGLTSKAGEFVALARKNGNLWYIGAMTDWEGRQMEIPLSFLEAKSYRLEYVEDGVNANRNASDYRYGTGSVKPSDILKIKLAPGGGYAAILTPAE
ncbi:MAG: glycoside hydrolase family 97 protein [Ignavibacteria bacterium]|nr:glycoside hydrolase family 97 protein [Ignavibacteria bacterium]MCU7502841.1 glycoside hydrolase family 97 protein [Ignavibacteria bacterium]MCU7515665.1 glycoside hydrolase family 97 protein [Ignavibacteria bacterium]